MSVNYKPSGYNSVSPYLIVDGAAGTIQFLRTVFGAEEIRRFSLNTGRIKHAEVRIDDTVLMIADPPGDRPPSPSHIHIYVPDVDASYQCALQSGAESVQEPLRQEDEDKRGGVRDAGGTTWWISTRVSQ